MRDERHRVLPRWPMPLARQGPPLRPAAAPLVPWTLHDLRRTVATGLQRLGVRLEVTEAVLNHISGSVQPDSRPLDHHGD